MDLPAIHYSPLGLRGPRRIKFKFRNCRIHLIPWLDIGNEKIHLRTKPAWIIQAASGDSNESCGAFIRLSSSQPRAAFGTEAALVSAARHARCEMVAQLPQRQAECRYWYQQAGNESATGYLLAITAVAFEHHNWFSGAFVTNRSAHAAASKGKLWSGHREASLFATLLVFASMVWVRSVRVPTFITVKILGAPIS